MFTNNSNSRKDARKIQTDMILSEDSLELSEVRYDTVDLFNIYLYTNLTTRVKDKNK